MTSEDPFVDSDPTAAEPLDAAQIQLQRLEQIRKYEAIAVNITNVLSSNLASVNCGLMRMAYSLEVQIKELRETGNLADAWPQLLKLIDTYLRITRQIDRFAQVELRQNEQMKLLTRTLDAVNRPQHSASEEFAV